MPSTPTFAIPYPCAGDVIDADVIAAYANGIDAALETVELASQAALTRPSIAIRTGTGGELVATNVNTNLTFTTIIHNEGVTATVPTTTVTIREDGMYRVTGAIASSITPTTVTRWRVIVAASTGRRVSASLSYTPVTVPGIALAPLSTFGVLRLPAATTLTLQALWVGTGGPISIAGVLYLNKICDL